MKSITVQEMRDLEEKAFAKGIAVLELMERAGKGCAELIEEKSQTIQSKLETRDRKSRDLQSRTLDELHSSRRSVVIFCGPANNGGDGFACARYLFEKGNTVALVVPVEPKSELARAKFQEAKNKQIKIISMDEAAFFKPDIVVDALLGIGAKLPLHGKIKEACKLINSMDAFKISIDIPSGMDADSGETDPDAVKPDATICIHAPKTGMVKAGKEKTGEVKAGIKKTGELWILDIGLT